MTTRPDLESGWDFGEPEVLDNDPDWGRETPLESYSHAELVFLVRLIESDPLLRTEDEFLAEALRELGYQRPGQKIVTALTAAIRGARAA